MCWNSAINTRLDSWYSVSSSQWGLMCDSTVAIRLCSLRNKICKTVSCGFWLALRSPKTTRHTDLCYKNNFHFFYSILLLNIKNTDRIGSTVLRLFAGRIRHSCLPPLEATVFRLWILLSTYRQFLHGAYLLTVGLNRTRKKHPSSVKRLLTKNNMQKTIFKLRIILRHKKRRFYFGNILCTNCF